MGVDQAVISTDEIGNGEKPYKYDPLLRLRNSFEDQGMEIAVMEGQLPITNATRHGRPGRDEEIENSIEFINNVGKLGIPVISYFWMDPTDWLRTNISLPTRGGALTTAYNHEQMERGPPLDGAPIREEALWENLEYFLERLVPVAEEAGVKLALHPDDPPLPSVRGIDRIIRSVEAYERVLEIYPSEANGITFCQGNFAAMGVDIPETIRRLGDSIHFVHFRDVSGEAADFVEEFHDAGPTDMLAAMEAYRDIGFDGVMRPDHVPTMAGEKNENPGYETLGRLFAIGYMKGLQEHL